MERALFNIFSKGIATKPETSTRIKQKLTLATKWNIFLKFSHHLWSKIKRSV